MTSTLLVHCSFLNPIPQLRQRHAFDLSPTNVYAGIHNEQEEGKDHGKYHHRTGSYEQSKHIKYCDYHFLPLYLYAHIYRPHLRAYQSYKAHIFRHGQTVNNSHAHP